MRACILSIGSELILGQITDTNATFLAQELSAAGIDLIYVTQVGDDQPLLLDAMRRSLDYADLLICTGGIGPTDDDLTRETIAQLVGETPTIDKTLLADLEDFFRGRGQQMPERNRKQAWTIPSATTLPNPIGTAPGWLVRKNGKLIVTMPGIPREMYRMWTEQALPRVLEHAGNRIIDSVTIKTIGIGESAAEDLLHDLVVRADPQVATYAKDDGVHIRVTAFGTDPEEVRARRDACRDEILQRLGDVVWGEDGDTLQSIVARDLEARKARLSIHEIGTGGALSSLLSADPLSASLFERNIVEPATQDSGDSAIQLAQEQSRSGLDGSAGSIGVALVYEGVLDERGVSQGQLAVAIRTPDSDSPVISTFHIRASLPEVQRRSALNAIEALRRYLKEQPAMLD